MKAMILKEVGMPLVYQEVPTPKPGSYQVLIKVLACGVCRTDLHIIDGELTSLKLPLILGHQIVGRVEEGTNRFLKGTLVGVPWLGKSCGICSYCKKNQENLCDDPTFTGYTTDGGFAEYSVADEEFIFPLNENTTPAHIAPLLCAGMIGYRSLRFCQEAKTIGFYGFGAAAHLLIQIANFEKKHVYAFTRSGDIKTQQTAKKLGAVWAGDSNTPPPLALDAAIIFAPVGSLIPTALSHVGKGGIVVCAGIHMSDIPSFPYKILWGERKIQSVANLTRKDGEEFLALAEKISIQTDITEYSLEKANEALKDLKEGKISGSAVLIP